MTISATIEEIDGRQLLRLHGVGFDQQTGRMRLVSGCVSSYDIPSREDIAPFIAKFEKLNGAKVEVKDL